MLRIGLVLAMTVSALALCLTFGERVINGVVRDILSEHAFSVARHWVEMMDEPLLEFIEKHEYVGEKQAGMMVNRHQQAHNQVFRYRLFSDDGHPLLDTGVADNHAGEGGCVHSHNHDHAPGDDTASKVIRNGSPQTFFLERTDNSALPLYYSETYLPVHRNGTIIGAAEVYIDMTLVYANMRDSLRRVALVYSTMVSAALLIPMSFVLLIWRRLKRSNEGLSIARDRALAAERSRAQFLANMSHEIRTPMNGIVGMAELLDGSPLNNDQKAFTSTIVRSSLALVEIINDILDFSKIDAGKMTVEQEPFDLYAIVHDVGALLAPIAEGKSIELVVDFRLPAQCYILGDAGRVRQCLLNIVGNAIKFTDKGYVVLTAEKDVDGFLEITVEDTGIGIDEEKMGTIFSAFEQADSKTTRKHEGTGLGLSISENLLALMGGNLHAASQVGKGSIFTITLPFVAAQPENTKAPPDLCRLPAGRALVIEDLEVNQSLIANMLRPMGVVCDGAYSADEGFQKLHNAKNNNAKYDLLLIDHTLPDEQSCDLLSRIAKDGDLRDIPTVLMSCAMIAQCSYAKSLPITVENLQKPIRVEAMHTVLHRAITRHPVQESETPITRKTAMLDLSGRTILTAEDNRTNQMVVEKMLAETGVSLSFCNNGAEIVKTYLTETHPDVILMDVSMPVLNGLDATRQIREAEKAHNWRRTPIIALTANATKEDKTACLAAGMDAVITKPLRKVVLMESLAEWI